MAFVDGGLSRVGHIAEIVWPRLYIENGELV